VTGVLVLVGVVVMMAGWYWWWGRSVLVDVLMEASNSILRGVHSAPRATHSGAPTLRRYHTSHVK
jgi:hypothetical protein